MAKRAFIDANVWFAAAYSPTGGSAALLEQAAKGEIIACTNQYVLDEAMRNLLFKADDCVEKYLLLLSEVAPTMVPDAISPDLHEELGSFVPEKDIPVLAGSILGKVDYLVTLDRRDLMNAMVRGRGWPFTILTPGDLVTLIRQKIV